ncbi:hypothetical protein C8Q72DRAFT_970443, partial [Fomitopsis betulina]
FRGKQCNFRDIRCRLHTYFEENLQDDHSLRIRRTPPRRDARSLSLGSTAGLALLPRGSSTTTLTLRRQVGRSGPKRRSDR